ncbi:MAG: DM13 domain-containing protein [Chloroflexota bacterium]
MNNRLRILVILIGAFMVIATFTYPRWQPFFVRQVAEDRFPGLSASQQTAFLALPTEQQGAFYELMSTADATMVVGLVRGAIVPVTIVPTANQGAPEMTDPTVVAVGTFKEIDAIHKASGKVTVFQLPDNSKVLRIEDFQVTNGPDLHVILTRKANPLTAADVGTDYYDLGNLQGTVGNQNYNMPSEVDLSQYLGVVIYSKLFQVVFSSAAIG